MHRFYVLIIFLSIILECAFPVNANSPIPDPELQSALLYKGMHAVGLITWKKQPSPFFLLVDNSGTGHLKSIAISSENYDREEHKLPNGLPDDWAVRPGFLKPDEGWTKLTSNECREMWGPFRINTVAGRRFNTSDVEGTFNSEKNLYHLDLCFQGSDLLKAYRVRGIGISNPKWITFSSLGQTQSDY